MSVSQSEVAAAMVRVAETLKAAKDDLTTLDQAAGDGDLGITAAKIAEALTAYAEGPETDDLGRFIGQAGLAVNKVASSTMGTLAATALMRAGQAVKGKTALSDADLAAALSAAAKGVMDRGKAKLGDKTVLDAFFPAADAFAAAIEAGKPRGEAAAAMVAAAKEGRDAVTPLQNKIGRAGWVGERTKGAVDPGCALLVAAAEGLAAKG
ncbi:MAG: DAK2 domain-containing protein [Pseudomonadota bacterium]